MKSRATRRLGSWNKMNEGRSASRGGQNRAEIRVRRDHDTVFNERSGEDLFVPGGVRCRSEISS
jgi:hypothetical protein